MGFLASWFVLSLGVALAAAVVPGFKVKGVWNTVVVATSFGVLNVLIGWLITLVLGIVTLGIAFFLGFITRWIVSAIVLLLVGTLTEKVTISGFVAALQAAAVIALSGVAAGWLFGG